MCALAACCCICRLVSSSLTNSFCLRYVPLLSAETSVKEAEITSDTVIIEANKTAKITLAEKKAEAEIIKLESGAQAEAFGAVKQAFSEMTSDELLKYVYLENMVGGRFKLAKLGIKIPDEIQAAIN